MKENDNERADKNQLVKSFHSLAESFFLKIRAEGERIMKEESFSGGQLFLLYTLDEQGTCKASDIAAYLGVTSGAVTAMGDKLVSMDLIKRDRTEEDRRMVLLSLTEKGREVVNRYRCNTFDTLLTGLGKLETAEIEQIIQVFARLNQIMETEKKEK